MIQDLGVLDNYPCPFCEHAHQLRLIAFGRKLLHNNQSALIPDFYHWCEVVDKGFQTSEDNVRSYIEKRKVIKQLEQPQQQMWSIQFN